jgi:hypothetical protein
MSWCRGPSWAHGQIFITIWQLRSCFCGAPSLTKGRVCLCYMLLVLASAVFLGSESLGTWDHILLSRTWDFPFRRLLRLAGSRWRYSTPPPQGWVRVPWQTLLLKCFGEPRRSHLFQQYSYCVLSRYYALNGLLAWLSAFSQLKLHCVYQNPRNRRSVVGCVTYEMCLPSRCLAIHVTIL